MPYCYTAFKTVYPEQVESLLSDLTKECFVKGDAAYQLQDGSYSIDAGENNIRAIYDNQKLTIKFLCRYERDVEFYDNKLLSFATEHKISVDN